MYLDHLSLSQLISDFSFSWEFVLAVCFVLLIGFLLAFVGFLARGVWGAIVFLAAGACLFLFT